MNYTTDPSPGQCFRGHKNNYCMYEAAFTASSGLQLRAFLGFGLGLGLVRSDLRRRILHQGVQLIPGRCAVLAFLGLRFSGLVGFDHRLQIPVRYLGLHILPDVLPLIVLALKSGLRDYSGTIRRDTLL